MARQMHCDYISKKKKKERKGREWGERKKEGAKKKEKGKWSQRGIQMGSSAGEAADAVRNSTWKSPRFFFSPSKAVLHFDYLVLLKAIQAALFVSVRMGPQKKNKRVRPCYFSHC